MATFLEGNPADSNGRFAIVVARFNTDITESLLDGCLHTLAQNGVGLDNIDVARVPGAFELPLTCDRLARSGNYAAVIALGCVIRGGTPHFDYVCTETIRGLMDVNLGHGVPVIMGLLTCDDLAQAQFRADRKVFQGSDQAVEGRTEKETPRSNKGSECAEAALEMSSLLSRI
ncbi:MAG: 6,7-dimethyl-8-ribityllumazine synthase [Planctomycetota bacterium]|nr:6,7-dimethyl-8-ribityllumazine synthase [Planctomycetota bacterium]